MGCQQSTPPRALAAEAKRRYDDADWTGALAKYEAAIQLLRQQRKEAADAADDSNIGNSNSSGGGAAGGSTRPAAPGSDDEMNEWQHRAAQCLLQLDRP